MQMRPRGDISKVAVRDGAAKRFENANFHDHTLIKWSVVRLPALLFLAIFWWLELKGGEHPPFPPKFV